MKKKLIAVIHLPPLPGSPRSEMSRSDIWDWVKEEAKTFMQAGIDGMILENHGDAPFYPDENPPHVVAIMSVLADRLQREFGGKIGINLLRNDGQGSLAAAAASGAQFIRVNVLSGLAATDQGLIAGRAHEIMRTRRNIQGEVEVWADINVKFATQLYVPKIADLARATAQRSLADAIIVTGNATGSAPDLDELKSVKEALPNQPVYAGSGVTAQSIATVLDSCDGAIVGSDLKVDGYVENPIDPERLSTFMAAFHRATDS